MSTGHTPGPWMVDPNYPGDIITADKRDIASAFNENHAGVSITIADSVFASLDEQSANARLIAAAPDLLAALQACEAFLFPRDRTSFQGGIDDAERMTIAAIVKATAA